MNLLERLVPVAHYEAKVTSAHEGPEYITVIYRIRKTPKTNREGMQQNDRVFLTVSKLEPTEGRK